MPISNSLTPNNHLRPPRPQTRPSLCSYHSPRNPHRFSKAPLVPKTASCTIPNQYARPIPRAQIRNKSIQTHFFVNSISTTHCFLAPFLVTVIVFGSLCALISFFRTITSPPPLAEKQQQTTFFDDKPDRRKRPLLLVSKVCL